MSKIGQLIEYCNTQLRNIDLGEGSYEADFIVRANCQYLTNLIFELSAGAALWGQNNPEALIAVNNISIDKNSIAVIGKNLDTIKFKLNGINYIQFKATDLIEKLDSYSENLIINLVGTPNINSWGGVETPQIQIKDIEIKELNLEGF